LRLPLLVHSPQTWLLTANAEQAAFWGSCLGVLIGADLLNLDKLRGLGTPVLSIGGAGTFDGIFVTGIMAVLLAGLSGGRASRQRS
jgi:uncharacterized membrane protein